VIADTATLACVAVIALAAVRISTLALTHGTQRLGAIFDTALLAATAILAVVVVATGALVYSTV